MIWICAATGIAICMLAIIGWFVVQIYREAGRCK